MADNLKVPQQTTVRVRNTDFNGATFDGNPFSTSPQWLLDEIHNGRIAISAISGATDYAVFDVQTPGGIVRALPDDTIEYHPDGSLHVVEYPERHRHPSRLPLPETSP